MECLFFPVNDLAARAFESDEITKNVGTEQKPRCEACKSHLEKFDALIDDGETITSDIAKCPKCNSTEAIKITNYTWWGGFLGPRLFNAVTCVNCGTKYNGTTGDYLNSAITIYLIIASVIMIVAVLLIFSNL